LHFAALRYFNACGALPDSGEAHQPESHLIPHVLNVALGQADCAYIYCTNYPTPDGTCIRDYIYIADLISPHILAVEELANRDRLIYNLGSGNGISVREVIDTASSVVGKQIPVREMPRRPGDSARLVASQKKSAANSAGSPSMTIYLTLSAAHGNGINNIHMAIELLLITD
jgi:UDP-glucose 4-epimerase